MSATIKFPTKLLAIRITLFQTYLNEDFRVDVGNHLFALRNS